MEANGDQQLSYNQHSSKYLLLYSIQEKKLIQVWNDRRVTGYNKCFHFWVNYPFNLFLEI